MPCSWCSTPSRAACADQDLHLPPRRLRHRRAPRRDQPGAAPVRRRCTCSCSTTATSRKATPGSTAASPVRPCTPPDEQVPEADLREHRKGQGRARDQGQRRLDRDVAALLRVGLHPADKRRARSTPRSWQQPVRHRHRAAAGHRGAGRDRVERTRACIRVRRTRRCWKRSPRAWNWSRTTAGRRSSPSRCSGSWTRCTSCWATGAGPSSPSPS
jgi:hypothetical protein